VSTATTAASTSAADIRDSLDIRSPLKGAGITVPTEAVPIEILRKYSSLRPLRAISPRSAPAHTDRTLGMDEMAKELDEVSRPSAQESVPLKHKVDNGQVF
jgi:hypothetical protein